MGARPCRTLVVEEDPEVRHLIQELVQARGHDVEACADAETAWNLVRRHPFSLTLLDLYLPGMDGVELCRKLRKLPYGGDMVVMFVTAADGMVELGRALEAGADDYVLKPVTDANLPARLALAERRIHFLRDRKRTEEGLARDALRDSVTDLANRTLFSERLQRTSRRAARENRRPGRAGKYLYAVLCMNLDGFGGVNARLGYAAGDEILRQLGQRLEECVRSADTVARFGGDEFVFLLDDMKDVSDPTRVVRRIEQALAPPFAVDGGTVHLTASVGISLSVGGSSEPTALFDEARQALIAAKEQGPGSHRIHDALVHARAMARLDLESRLRAAVDDGQMTLHYQPIVSTTDGRTVGYEALVRWNDPTRGLVAPEEFIEIAEHTGAVIPLGWWILREAIQRLGRLRALAPEEADPFVSVNVSPRQFAEPGMQDRLAAEFASSGLPRGSLRVEITETALMTDVDAASGALARLREASIETYVDDFGTGYSSLSYLCRLPLTGLKVDRSFVNRVTDSRPNLEVVRTIARLAESLGLSTVAEGVETERQVEEIRSLGIPYAQGFLYGRPIPADELERRFEREAGSGAKAVGRSGG